MTLKRKVRLEPLGITIECDATEHAQGHVLLCRTHVRSDLVIELLTGSLLAPPLPDRHGGRSSSMK